MKRIQLSPFSHQVGGHSSMFQFNRTTLCKVLDHAELDFYRTMPDLLKRFTPEFRGIINASYYEDEFGCIKLVIHPETSCNEAESSGDESIHLDSISSDGDGSKESNDCSEDGQMESSQSLVTYQQGESTVSKINPWILQLSKKNAEKLHKQFIRDEALNVPHKFILLENVTARFCYPCILDLKMGKRQHAELDSDKKRQSKIEKCQLSTSSTLGVRLCGMQVYQIDHNRYVFTDKYRGRLLTIDGFNTALAEFLNNGQYKRLDILPSLIQRLESLYKTINCLSKYRFYSGSLLIVYDGLPSSDLIDLRMIDFAHTILVTDPSTSNSLIDPDQDYLFGLQRLIDVFRNILANPN